MKKIQKNLKPKVLFNASVVLSGLNSPKGGSAKVLSYIQAKKIDGVISEIILDEILRHSNKIGYTKERLYRKCISIFKKIEISPKLETVKKYKNIVTDEGDCHVLASAEEVGADYLVSLDKKHILVLQNKLKKLKIVTPAELIASFN